MSARPVQWWEAAPLRTDRAGAQAAAWALLALGLPFTRSQNLRLLAIGCTWRKGRKGHLDRDLALLGALQALARDGGWLPGRGGWVWCRTSHEKACCP